MKLYPVLFVILLFYSGAFAQPDTTQKIVSGRRNSLEQQKKPYLIIISADGFRYDYAEKFGAENLLKLSKKGVRAASLIPSFPSKTFPNHYTLATGLYPSHHGIPANRFYDPQRQEFYSPAKREMVEDESWYGGVPLWVLAEQQQLLSASFYWVGSEAPVKGVYPTYYYRYNELIPIEERIKTVVEWPKLPENQRPHLITFYFPEVDHAGHSYGPDAPETAKAVRFIDKSVQQLTEEVAKTGLEVNFMFVSDHGMTRADTENLIPFPKVADSAEFVISKGDMQVELHAKNRKDIKKTYRKLKKQEQGYSVYLKSNMPAHLQYNTENDSFNRIGDIILLAHWPRIFSFSDSNSQPLPPGRHGYDPSGVKDMHATFYAWGPAFKENMQIPSFENVQVYPIVADILGLKYTHAIDGDHEVAEDILLPQSSEEEP